MGSSCASYRVGNFELKWTDFVDNLASSFIDLRDEGDLLDVTLVCGDDQLAAHKVILSASSLFFKSVIKRNPHAHPLIYLKGVKIEDLKALIDFIYLGQTKVCQEDVQAFLVLGEELGVKGLARDKRIENMGKETNKHPGIIADFDEGEQAKGTLKRMRMDREENSTNVEVKMEDSLVFDVDNSLENCKNVVLLENVENYLNDTAASEMTKKLPNNSNFVDSDSTVMSIDEEIDARIETHLTKTTNIEGQTGYQCTKCNTFLKNKRNLEKHVEIHLSFPCTVCEKIYKTRSTLHTHMYKSVK